MAKINETVFVVKVSELVKDHADVRDILDEETLAQLEAIIQELAGASALVEIETLGDN
jgi:hypothetical protein